MRTSKGGRPFQANGRAGGPQTSAWKAGVLQEAIAPKRAVDSLLTSVRAFIHEDEILGLLGAVGILSKQSAPAFRAGGPRFESGRPDQNYPAYFLQLIKKVLHP